MRSISETRPARGAGSGRPAQALDHLEDAEHFLAVSDHLAVAGLTPAEDPVPVDDERGAVGDVPVGVVDAVGADGLAMDVTQQREGEALRLRVRVVAEGAVAADREEADPLSLELLGDLTQAGQLGRSDVAPVVAV